MEVIRRQMKLTVSDTAPRERRLPPRPPTSGSTCSPGRPCRWSLGGQGSLTCRPHESPQAQPRGGQLGPSGAWSPAGPLAPEDSSQSQEVMAGAGLRAGKRALACTWGRKASSGGRGQHRSPVPSACFPHAPPQGESSWLCAGTPSRGQLTLLPFLLPDPGPTPFPGEPHPRDTFPEQPQPLPRASSCLWSVSKGTPATAEGNLGRTCVSMLPGVTRVNPYLHSPSCLGTGSSARGSWVYRSPPSLAEVSPDTHNAAPPGRGPLCHPAGTPRCWPSVPAPSVWASPASTGPRLFHSVSFTSGT